jgi:prolyl 4-hydroxylase
MLWPLRGGVLILSILHFPFTVADGVEEVDDSSCPADGRDVAGCLEKQKAKRTAAAVETSPLKTGTVPEGPLPVRAVFKNNLKKEVSLMWQNGDSLVDLGKIKPEGTLGMGSFSGHVFEVHQAGVGLVSTFVMDPDESNYVIGDEAEASKEPNIEMVKSFGRSTPIRFVNLCNRTMAMWYRPNEGAIGTRTAILEPNGASASNSYPGHVWCITDKLATDGCKSSVQLFTVDPEQYSYLIDDGSGRQEDIDAYHAEEAGRAEYRAKTGRHWLSVWGRKPPRLYMHPANRVGDVIKVRTKVPIMMEPPDAPIDELSLQVISTEPSAFLVPKLFTDAEADYLVELGRATVAVSKTGQGESAFVSKTRTSKNTFVPRHTSNITENLFSRISDLLNVPDSVLHHSNDEGVAEHLQIVHYSVGQRYDAHHDWGVRGSDPRMRCITVLLYLNNPPGGGHTSFPKAKRQPDEPPLILHPGKGSAVVFYNILPDGNADDLALHAAMPVTHGEKWLANFWLWDPSRHH